MGIPVTDPAERSNRDSSAFLCPVLRQSRRSERSPFRRTLPFLPFLENSLPGTIWHRNTRQRGEVLHTEAPEVNDDSRSEPAASVESPREQAEIDAPALDVPVLEHNAETLKRHKYKLRLGYDPRIFLEDPRMRGQQLSEEAEKWAASYRSQIPMQTDPQMARRVMDAEELSRFVQTESGDALRARSASEEGREGGVVYRAQYSSVSDVEDDDDDEDHSDDNEGAPAQQQEPLAHITNALLHGVSPNDYTSRVEDSLAVLGQALRANGAVTRGSGARTVGVQAAPGSGPRARAPIHPSLLERVNDLNQDLGRILDNGNTGRTGTNRRLTRIAGYLQRQMNTGSGDMGHSSDTA